MSFCFDAIRLRYVRGFGAEGVALDNLSPGLNVLSQPNEFGKSTILAAMKAALFYKATADSKVVRSLYGFDGDPPEIEIDFTTDKGARRLSKRFRKGRGETKLFERPSLKEIAREADAEREVLRLVGADKPENGPGGLLWVEQGSALSDLEAPQKAAIAEALASEVSELSSSEEALRLGQTIARELAEFETAKTGKPTKKLLAALTDVDEAEAALATAETTLTTAQSYRDRLVSLNAELRERAQPGNVARDEEELAQARTVAQELRRKAESLSHTEQTVTRLNGAKDQALDRLERWERDVKRLQELSELVGMAAANEAEMADEAGMAKGQSEECAAAVTSLELHQKSLRVSLRRADAFERFAQNQARQDAAQRTLAEVKKCMADKNAAAAIVGRGALNVNALRELERDILVAEAALDAASPEVELVNGADAALDGVDLEPGQARRVRGEAKLTVGAAELLVRASLPRDLIERRDRARAELALQLEAAGVQSIDQAEAEAAARRDASLDLKRLDEEIKRLAPKGLSDLETNAALELVEPEGEPPDEPRDELERQLSDTEAGLEQARARLNGARTRQEEFDKKLIVSRAEAQVRKQEMEQLALDLGTDEDRAAARKELERAITEQAAQLAEAERAVIELRQGQKDHEAAERRVKRLEEAKANRERKLTSLKVEIGQLEGQLMQVYQQGPEESRDAAAERLESAQARLDRCEARRSALKRLKATLDAVQSERRDRLLKPLIEATTPLIDQVFGVGALRFGADLTPHSLEREGVLQDVDTLSAGAREQIAIVTRLGMARLYAGRGQGVPIILDDALIYADDGRTDRLFDALQLVAEETQVIVLTCHERRFDALGGNRLEPKAFLPSV
ncbi:MAG: AAA family ATPase [Pseudomonadota bacterium]